MADARISWISGPVLRATTQRAFRVNEAARVGAQGLLGEVIRIDGDELVIQVYEDTTGLRPGDPITGTGSALSVKLGPGLLGTIFDGLLRPLVGARPLVPDEMVRTFVLCGKPESIRERIERAWGIADSMVVIPPAYGIDPIKMMQYQAAIAELLY